MRRRMTKFWAGILCAALLFTSESMSGLAYAAADISELQRDDTELLNEKEVVSLSENEAGKKDILEENLFREENLSQDTDTEVSDVQADNVQPDNVQTDDMQPKEDEIITESIKNAYQFGEAPSAEENASLYAVSGEDAGSEVMEYLYREIRNRNTAIDLTSYKIPVSTDEKGEVTGSEALAAILSGVLNEYPDLYFVGQMYSLSVNSEKIVTSLKLTYADDLDDVAFQEEATAALASVSGIEDDLQKAVLLHDYLAVNCEYDKENCDKNTIPQVSYSAYGVLVNRTAVCEGYALAYKYLLNRAGIECYMVTSESMNHAWNLVKLGENYYQVDVTWDDPTWDLVGRVKHTYMLRSDNAFTEHQGWVVTKGSSVVDYTAVDTTYDSAFWIKSTAPLVLLNNVWYYVFFDDTEGIKCSIQKRALSDVDGITVCEFGYWPVWSSSDGRYYEGAYSGLSLIQGRLYYNDKDKIYSINPDGTEQKEEFVADTSEGYIYGSIYCQGKMKYAMHQSPNLNEKETVLSAKLASISGGTEPDPEPELPDPPKELEPQELKDIELVDEKGNPIGDELTMTVGEQRVFAVKLLPEGAVTDKEVIWRTANKQYLTVENGVVTAQKESDSRKAVISVTVGDFIKECQVTVVAATENISCGQDRFVISGSGMGNIKKLDESNWTADILAGTQVSVEGSRDTKTELLFVNERGGMSLSEDGRIQGGTGFSTSKRVIIREDTKLQLAVQDRNTRLLKEGIYTIDFHVVNSEFSVDNSLNAFPDGQELELKVKELPDSCKVEDIEWVSSDTRIVKIGAKTKDGVLLQTGSLEGVVQVTAKVKDSMGRYRYAVCNVDVNKTVPVPSFKSTQGGSGFSTDISEEETIWYSLIDKGGQVTLAVEGLEDAEIFYTLDGSDPMEKGKKYEFPITITERTRIKAFARLEGYRDSEIAEEEFRIGTSRLTISLSSMSLPQNTEKKVYITEAITAVPTGITKSDVQWSSSNEEAVSVVTDTDETPDGDIGEEFLRITANNEGKAVITASVEDYAGRTLKAEFSVVVPHKVGTPVFVPNEETGPTMDVVKIVTGKDEDGESYEDEVITTYVIVEKGGTIAINPAEGEGDDEVIYYTTDGSKPTTASAVYTKPIKITKRCVVRAIAVRSGCTNSDMAEVRYTPYDTSLSLSNTTLSINAGARKEISVTKWPTKAAGDDNPTLTWISSDDRIATVETETETIEKVVGKDEDGEPIIEEIEKEHIYITGVAGGKAQVIASYKDFAGNTREAVCNVTVAGKLEITSAISLTEGESRQLKVTKKPQNIQASDINWSSDNSIITVEDGRVTAGTMSDTKEPVESIICASVTMPGGEDGEDIEINAYCKVTVIPQAFTVSFIGWNGKTAKTERVYRGQNATPPEAEAMTLAAPAGWEFQGWNGNCENIQGDTIITALEYKPTDYTISYDMQGRGMLPTDIQTRYNVKSDTIALVDPGVTDKEYVFAGWYRDEHYTEGPVAEIPKGSIGNIVLYAKWIPAESKMYIVEFPDPVYTGKAIKPEIRVYDGTTLLTQGTDYTIKYKNNTKANGLTTDTEKKNSPRVIVTGKGNYTDSVTVEFKILPKSLSENDVTADAMYMAYSGKKLTPAPVVKWNGKKLSGKTDYTVRELRKDGEVVSECREEGEYTLVVEGKGNYSGERSIPLTVTKKTLINKVTIGNIADIEWNGEPVASSKLLPKLTHGKKQLIKDTDYTLEYDESATDIGSYEIKIIGKGDYEGTAVKTFKIKGKAINAKNLTVIGMETKYYNGEAHTQRLSILYGTGKKAVPMMEGRDYTLTYLNNTNAGKKATVVITGKGAYSGTVKKTFVIKAYSLKTGYDTEGITAEFAQSGPFYHEKGGVKPGVNVYYGEKLLTEGAEYTLKYQNNGKVAKAGDRKPPTVTISGKGNFSGSVSLVFTIVPQDLSQTSITANDITAGAATGMDTIGYTKAGKYKSTPVLTDKNGKKLIAGTDYKKQYIYTDENGNVLGSRDKVPAGSVLTVKVTGTGSYTGEISTSYRVLKAKTSVAAATISLKKGLVKNYTGEPVTLSKDDFTVMIGKEILSPSDYTIVSYTNNRMKGKAKVTIRGIGNYGGIRTINFTVSARKLQNNL